MVFVVTVIGRIGSSIFADQPIKAVQAALLITDHVDGLGDVVTILIGSSIITLFIT